MAGAGRPCGSVLGRRAAARRASAAPEPMPSPPTRADLATAASAPTWSARSEFALQAFTSTYAECRFAVLRVVLVSFGFLRRRLWGSKFGHQKASLIYKKIDLALSPHSNSLPLEGPLVLRRALLSWGAIWLVGHWQARCPDVSEALVILAPLLINPSVWHA